jgi:hypothetical protein
MPFNSRQVVTRILRALKHLILLVPQRLRVISAARQGLGEMNSIESVETDVNTEPAIPTTVTVTVIIIRVKPTVKIPGIRPLQLGPNRTV